MSTREESLALAAVDVAAFDGDLAISERAFAPAVLGVEGVCGLLAWDGDVPVGSGMAVLPAGAVGIFGIAVVPRARRRGIGTALTLAAADAFPADLAWLLPSEMARSMYQRLGFRALEPWEIRVRREPPRS